MILGIGIDICDIHRIEDSMARFGQAFEDRLFTPAEQEKAQSRKGGGVKAIACTYAKRFAAKEACRKALSIAENQGIGWRDIEVTNAENGAPALILHGGALAKLAALTPAGMQAKLWLTLSDEYPYATAQVVIEAVPAQPAGA